MESMGLQISIAEIVQIGLMISYVLITWKILAANSKLTHESFRPKIYADFRFREQSMSFVIKNVGQRAAYNINVRLTPDLKYKMPNEQGLSNHPMLKNLSFLSPQEEATTSIGIASDVLNMQQENELNVDVTYLDEGNKQFTEKYRLNLDSYRRAYVDHKDISDMAKSLEKIEKHIAVISKNQPQQK